MQEETIQNQEQEVNEQEEKQQPDQEETQPEEQQASERPNPEQPSQRVSPLDPDFIIIFFAACFFDFSDVFTDSITTIVQIPVPGASGILFDIAAIIIIGGWIYRRSGQLASTSKAMGGTNKVAMAVAKRIVHASIIEIGSKAGLGITAWIGLAPSWIISVLSMVFKIF